MATLLDGHKNHSMKKIFSIITGLLLTAASFAQQQVAFIKFNGSTSGQTTVQASAVASGTASFPAGTGTLLYANGSGAALTALTAASITAGALANGMTATTQTVGDNSTKLATTAFVLANAGGGITGPGTTVTNTISLWGNTTGTSLINSPVTITTSTNVTTMTLNSGSTIIDTAGAMTLTSSGNSSITLNGWSNGSTSGSIHIVNRTSGAGLALMDAFAPSLSTGGSVAYAMFGVSASNCGTLGYMYSSLGAGVNGVELGVNNSTFSVLFDGNQDIRIGKGTVATTATHGFVYISSAAGTPTGTPASFSGFIPLVVDSTNNQLDFYSGSSWQKLSAGGGVSSIAGTANQIVASASTGAVTLSLATSITNVNSLTSSANNNLSFSTLSSDRDITFTTNETTGAYAFQFVNNVSTNSGIGGISSFNPNLQAGAGVYNVFGMANGQYQAAVLGFINNNTGNIGNAEFLAVGGAAGGIMIYGSGNVRLNAPTNFGDSMSGVLQLINSTSATAGIDFGALQLYQSNNTGAGVLTVTGSFLTAGSITTGTPAGGAGAAAWKVGQVRTSTALIVSTTTGVQLDVGGMLVTLATLTTNP